MLKKWKFVKRIGAIFGFVRGFEYFISIILGSMIGYFSKLNEIIGLWLSIPLSIAGILIILLIVAYLFLLIKERLENKRQEPTQLMTNYDNHFLCNKLDDLELSLLVEGKFDFQNKKFYLRREESIGKVIFHKHDFTFGNLIANFFNSYKKQQIFIPKNATFFTLRFTIGAFSSCNIDFDLYIENNGEEKQGFSQSTNDKRIRLPKNILGGSATFQYKIILKNQNLITVDDRNAKSELRIELISIEF